MRGLIRGSKFLTEEDLPLCRAKHHRRPRCRAKNYYRKGAIGLSTRGIIVPVCGHCIKVDGFRALEGLVQGCIVHTFHGSVLEEFFVQKIHED